MRIPFAILVLLFAAAAVEPARADPYRYCAEYSPGSAGETNCYFVTLEQCRASVQGNSGFCRINGFYDGRPVGTPGEAAPRSRRHGSH